MTPHPHVELLIHNAVIWSPGGVTGHTALTASAGRITALGGEDLCATVDADHIIDARGGLVTPGFVDAHVHAAFAGVEANRCDLSLLDSWEEAAAAISAYAAAHPEVPWVLGGGWRMPWFPGGTPTRQQLDALVPDRPAFFLNADHHGAWANTRALHLAGITAQTPDPADGRIEREPDGTPAGTLHEGAAELLDAVLPPCTHHEMREGLRTAQQRLFAVGVIGWQEAILGPYGGYPDATPVYAEAVADGTITGHVSGALWVSRDFDGLGIPGFVAELVRRRAAYARAGLRLDTAKIMVDGVPENETAAMREPYADGSCACSRGTGLAYFSREQLLTLVPLLNEAGFDAHLHAIGDRAVGYALDAIAAVPEPVRAARRNHIAHLQVVDPADVPRFASLGVTANLQALWACRDEQMEQLTLGLLGPVRAEWQYPFASLERTGARLACGSDWPVSTPDPWQAIHVAVTRQEPAPGGAAGAAGGASAGAAAERGSAERGGAPAEAAVPDGAAAEALAPAAAAPLVPHEALSLETILTAYTLGSHELLGVPGGSIAVGEPCDLAIADRNPFALPAHELHTTRNATTVLGGAVVFHAGAPAAENPRGKLR